MEIELQVHKCLFKRVHNIISGNINSAFHGLNLAAIHEQEKWHFLLLPGIERRRDLLIAGFDLAKHRCLG